MRPHGRARRRRAALGRRPHLRRLAGAVVVPQALAAKVAAEAAEQERMEAWIITEVGRGAALPGLYPMDAATRARYEATR